MINEKYNQIIDDAWDNFQRKVLDKFMSDTTIAGYAITNKEEFINKIKTDDEFAKKWGELGPIYGAQWRRFNAPYITKAEKHIAEQFVGGVEAYNNHFSKNK